MLPQEIFIIEHSGTLFQRFWNPRISHSQAGLEFFQILKINLTFGRGRWRGNGSKFMSGLSKKNK